MSFLDGLRHRWRTWLAPQGHARDAERELRFHLDLEAAQRRADGASTDEAAFAARRRLGNATNIAEDVRRAAGLGWIDALRQDLTFAMRGLRSAPGFAVVAALTLALGVGATTAVFSVIDSVLIQPLPIPQPDRVLAFSLTEKQRSFGGTHHIPSSMPQYLRWQQELKSFATVAAVGEPGLSYVGPRIEGEMRQSSDDAEHKIGVTPISSRFFALARLKPALGRPLVADDDRPGAQAVALIGYTYWRRVYGGDRSVIGRTILLQGEAHTIVGVMPAGFSFPGNTQVWTGFGARFGGFVSNEGTFVVDVMGRLRDGVPAATGRAEVETTYARDASAHRVLQNFTVSVLGVRDAIVARVAAPLTIMMGFVAILLLIAAANVINMLLARGMARQHDVAVRLALGAGRGRIVRQFITEAVVLATIGALAGVGAAALIVRFIVAQQALDLPRRGDIGLHPTVLVVCVATALAVGLVCGLVPALSVSRDAIDGALRSDGGRLTGSRRRRRLRNALVMGEMALAIVLLAGAGLLLKSFLGLMELRPGLTGENVMGGLVSFGLPESDSLERVAMGLELGERLRATPGLALASVTSSYPFGMGFEIRGIKVPGADLDTAVHPYTVVSGIDSAYFRTLGVRIVRGRAFTQGDLRRGDVAIISEALARRYFGGRDPIGKRMLMQSADSLSVEVVGIAEDVRFAGLDLTPEPETYVPLATEGAFQVCILARATHGDPAALMPTIDRVVHQVAPHARLRGFAPLSDVMAQTAAEPHVYLVLLGGFAVVATLLTALGLYGVIAYSVAQRTREIGIRVALGASPWLVRRRVVGQGVALAVAGVVAGGAVSIVATRVLRSILYGVSPGDPFVLAAAAVVLVAVATVACWLPAHRAAAVDPLQAIRAE